MRRNRGHADDVHPAKASRHSFPGSVGTDAREGPLSTDQWLDLLLRAGVIVLATLWIYSPTYHGDWLWDDDTLLTANPVVQSGTLAGLWKLWFDPSGADYFPLSYSALWAQWPVFGTDPTGYHAVTIILHAVGSLLLWRLLVVMRIPGAWLAGLLFAIHPVCVETVAWVSEIKNTISLPPFLIAAICFAEHDAAAQGSGPDAQRRSSVYHSLAIGWYLVAMFAKTSMVMFPVVLLLHAWWRRGRIGSRDLGAAAPFFLVSFVLGLVTIHFQHGRAIGEERMPVADLFSLAGLLSRTAVAGMAILFYLWKSVCPTHLLPIYPRWEVDPPQPWQLLPWPIMAGAAWWLWSRRGTAGAPTPERHALFALGFFVLMLLPILGFITISYMRITWVADHFLYLPVIGPIALVSAFAACWFSALRPRFQLPVVATAATMIAIVAFASFRYAHVFAGEDPLWTHTLLSNPDAWQAHNRLGARMLTRGDIDGALSHFESSTRLRPDLGETHNNLGLALVAKGRVEEALPHYRTATELAPHVPKVYFNHASALLSVGRLDEAETLLRKLVEQFPTLVQGWNNLGFVQFQRGDSVAAIVSLRRAESLDPKAPDVRANLQAALRAEAERSARNRTGAPTAGAGLRSPGTPPLEQAPFPSTLAPPPGLR